MSDSLWGMLEETNIDAKYYLEKLLGYGSYGGVFLANEYVGNHFIRQVAVKLIKPDKDQQNSTKQLQELIAAVNLEHPNLVRCFLPGQCTIGRYDFLYLVMELAQGTLQQHIDKTKTLPVAEVEEIVKAIASALVYLHGERNPRVHRDLKPGNILRVGSSWKLSDFGLLRSMNSQKSERTNTENGTHGYSPPESYEGVVAVSWDIWSLGVMIVEMLTGQFPFTGKTNEQLMAQVMKEPPSIDWSKIPEPLAGIVKGCLEKDRNKRPTAAKVLDAVTKKISTPNIDLFSVRDQVTGIVIGIYLGKTFSAMAYMKDGKAEIIPNSEGEKITPSVVFFDDESIVVGTYAKDVAVSEGDLVVQFIKCRMGDDYVIKQQGRDWRPEEIAALILKRLKQDAESYFYRNIRYAVITVPAYFDYQKRMATKIAGELAGLNVLQIINEPTAALMEFAASHEVQNKTILVCDWGDRTFDVTILRVEGKKIDVIAIGGNHELGEKDIDDRIITYFQEQFQKATGVDLLNSLAGQQRLRNEAEAAKKRLSASPNTQITLDIDGHQASFKIDKAKFEELIDDLMLLAEINVELVLEDAELTPHQIDDVLLLGGSSPIPAVSKMLTKIFGKEPRKMVIRDEVFAKGAAILAQSFAIESGQAIPAPNKVLPKFSDLCSHSLGVVTLNDYGVPENSIIIPKNSKIPCNFSGTYGTVRDNQNSVEIQILQGEHKDPYYCADFGRVRIENIPPSPSGSAVEITYAYDANGIFSVTGVFVPTGQPLKTIINYNN